MYYNNNKKPVFVTSHIYTRRRRSYTILTIFFLKSNFILTETPLAVAACSMCDFYIGTSRDDRIPYNNIYTYI